MTRAAQKSKSSLRAASKSSLAPKSAAHRGTKPDARLADADKFLLPTCKRPPIVLTHGRGAYVYDSAGKTTRADLKGSGDPLTAFTSEMQTAVDAVRSGTEPDLLSGKLARDALALCHKECQSVRSGKPVNV